MKKIVRLFPVLILIVMTILTITLEDMKEKELYKNINGYQFTAFIIPENIEHITNDDIDQVFDSTKKFNVILLKQVYNKEKDSIDTYASVDDIYSLYSKQLNFKSKETNDLLGVSTFKDSNNLYYPDFLNNDRFSFYPTSMMKSNKIYRHGSYFVYYQNEEDYFNFIDNAKQILNVPAESLTNEAMGQLEEPIDFFNLATIFGVVFFTIFYFVLMLFLFYRNSKTIGILTLMGFSNMDILRKILKKFSLSIMLTSLLLFILSILILVNINVTILIKFIILDIFMIVISFIISYLSLLFLQKYYSLSNILKKQSIVRKISNLCLMCKFIMIGCMILFTINCLPLIQESMQSSKNLKDNQILMDYAVFSRIREENSDYEDYDKYLEFYKEVKKQDIDHIYVKFGDYLETDQTLVEELENAERNGERFRIASVDLNYLNLYDVSCYNFDGETTNLKNVKQEVYLLPKSKKEYTKALNTNLKKKYKNYNIKHPVSIYYYNDQLFDTFDSQSGIKKVESPIFRIVDQNNPYTYFDTDYGLDIAGTSMTTALKFNISNMDENHRQKLFQCIKDVGLEKVLVEDNFISYKDYYNELITRVYNTNTIFISGMIICLCIYIFMLFQTFALFIDARKNEILVKSLIGFNRKAIFENVIFWNIGATLVPICCICAYTLASGMEGLLLILGVSFIFLMIDLIMLFIITKTIKLTKIYTELKGE